MPQSSQQSKSLQNQMEILVRNMFRCGGIFSRLWLCYETHLRKQLGIRKYSSSNKKTAAFVFDIDGVLIRGKQVLDPGSFFFKLLRRDT